MFNSPYSDGGGGHEEEQLDRYLITYADLITLLLGLFVILYASSQVDAGKYQEFAAAFSEYFNNEGNGGDGILNDGSGLLQPVIPPSETKTVDDLDQEIQQSLSQQIRDNNISLERTADGLTVKLPEALLFRESEAELQPGSLPILDSLAAIFNGIDQQILVVGHTDSRPISTFQFASNWHLSVSRALNVAWYGIRKGMPEERVNISGYGSQRPVADNGTPEGRAQNRRVEIVIKELPDHIPDKGGYAPPSVPNTNDEETQ